MNAQDLAQLEAASRTDLIVRAEELGIDNASVLTRVELVDEIVKRTVDDPLERRLARGFLGVARDLVARVVERGLHLPDAAALIRGIQQATLTPVTPPIATVTLAEIYAGQGHRDRALAVLDEVLANEPDHAAARQLRDKVALIPADARRGIAPSEEPPAPVVESAVPSAERVAAERLAAERAAAERTVVERPVPAVASLVDEGHAVPNVSAVPEVVSAVVPEVAEPPYVEPPVEPPPLVEPLAASARSWSEAPFEPVTDPRLVVVGAGAGQAFDSDDAVPTLRPEGLPTIPHLMTSELVLIPLDEATVFAYWEVRQAAIDEALDRAKKGVLVLRIIAVTATWEGPESETRDVEVVRGVDDCWVRDLPTGAILRGAIGVRDGQNFEPLAVAMDVTPAERIDDVLDEEGAQVAESSARLRIAEPFGSIDAVDRARSRVTTSERSVDGGFASWRALPKAPREMPYEAQAS